MSNSVKLMVGLVLILGLGIVSLTSFTVKYQKEVVTLTDTLKVKESKIKELEVFNSMLKERKEEVKIVYKDGSSYSKTTYAKDVQVDSSKTTEVAVKEKEKDNSKSEEKLTIDVSKPVNIGAGVMIKAFDLQNRLYYLHISKPVIFNLGLEAQVQSNFINSTYLGVGISYNL